MERWHQQLAPFRRVSGSGQTARAIWLALDVGRPWYRRDLDWLVSGLGRGPRPGLRTSSRLRQCWLRPCSAVLRRAPPKELRFRAPAFGAFSLSTGLWPAQFWQVMTNRAWDDCRADPSGSLGPCKTTGACGGGSRAGPAWVVVSAEPRARCIWFRWFA